MSATALQAFGERVRAARERLGWSQAELARRADMHRTYIGGIERGERNISLLNILRLMQALGAEPNDLIDMPVQI